VEKFPYLKNSVMQGVVTAEQGKKLPRTKLDEINFPSLNDIYETFPEFLKTKKDREKSEVVKLFEKSFKKTYYKLQKEYWLEHANYKTSLKNKEYVQRKNDFIRQKTQEIRNKKLAPLTVCYK